MKKLMRKIGAILIGLSYVMLLGCADAKAATSTYLPVDESCPFDADESGGQSVWELPDPMWEVEDADGGEEAVDDDELEDGVEGQFADRAGVSDGAEGAGDQELQELIDLNRAGVDELTQLPGIGPSLAQRIVDYRQQRRFEDPRQLMRVQGIGPATWERIGSMVTVD